MESELSVLRKMKLKKNNVYVIRIVKQAKEILEDLELFSEKGLRTHPSAAMVKKSAVPELIWQVRFWQAVRSIRRRRAIIIWN